MTDNELLRAMKGLLAPIYKKLEDVDLKLAKLQVQADTLQLDMRTSERAIRKDIHSLYDDMDTLMKALEKKESLPKTK